MIAAAKDIPLGSVLTIGGPDDDDPGGHAAQGRDLKQEDAIGRGVITQISQGEPILDSQLAGHRLWWRIGADDSKGHAGMRGASG